ncbi:ATP-binding cassette transporter CGR1 [Tilletia horrida]|uniref:ATP-binding cassette transporter CGR1 n=1 Tax=Tilletia horrida TaxID=155126 RepID=A0AAN6GWH1_9BASI|nr:ATP-binding cassette transporter CGR1 [Tilletia horrida]KAK0569194.1 ATP-binding cassette transporter CGR1 [Tilletia horrida]
MGGHSGEGAGESNTRPPYDQVVQDIADYVHNYDITSDVAYNTARLCLLDSLGCAVEALRFPQAVSVLGPVVEGTVVPNGSRVIGTNFVLDPIRGAFNNGALIRWLDFNDTWLAAEWGHPSDNLGAIITVADWISRTNVANGKAPLKVQDILTAAIKAHEIQGNLAIENSFNRVGLDHVLLVKVASAAVVSKLIGNTRDQTVDVITQAFVDGQSLRTYRHAPNASSRKSWAAGDACSRAVNLALLVQKGQPGLPSVLTAKVWGFYDVLFKGKEFAFQRPYTSYVMENVLFKLVPAEFHAQTACEAAILAHGELTKAGKTSDDIETVKLKTQEAAIRIISKAGKLHNYADRDHSLQYMVAVSLMNGKLTPDMYNDDYAENPKIDELRAKMEVKEEARYTKEYMEADKRSIGNSLELKLKDGSTIGPIALDYPVGHARRREEAIPLIASKLKKHLEGHFDQAKESKILSLLEDHQALANLDVPEFVELWTKA